MGILHQITKRKLKLST